jgi:hypothetical protein
MEELCECGHEKEKHHFGMGCFKCAAGHPALDCAVFRPQKSWDSSEGQTHYENDGCGCKEHNDPAKLIEPPQKEPRLLTAEDGAFLGIRPEKEEKEIEDLANEFMKICKEYSAAREKEAYQKGKENGYAESESNYHFEDAEKECIKQTRASVLAQVRGIVDSVDIFANLGASENEKKISEYLLTFWEENLKPKIIDALKIIEAAGKE